MLGFDNGRQMIVDQRKNITVAFCNHFVVADSENYNEVHGKYSCIQIKAEDFKKGKGNNAVWAYCNLNPYEIRSLYQIVKSIYPLCGNMELKKEFYHPYNQRYTSLFIEHAPKLNNPFVMTITEGKCDANKRIGEPLKKITVMYSDELFFQIWDTLYNRMRDWERYHYSLLLKTGEPKTAAAISQYKQNKGNNSAQQQPSRTPQQPNKAQRNVPPMQQQKQQKPPVKDGYLPPPPMMAEDEIPFNQMPAYGSGYKKR